MAPGSPWASAYRYQVRQYRRVATSFEVVTDVKAPAHVLFRLALDTAVHSASLRRTRETATTSSGRAELGLGDEVTFTARHWGIRWRMTSRVTEHRAPDRFVDEQVAGPFAQLRHEHLFEPVAEGARMIDRVVFTAPLGLLGRGVERVVLRRHLETLIRTRALFLKAEAEAAVTDPQA